MSQPKTYPRGTRRPLGCKAGNCDQLDAFPDLPCPFNEPTQYLRLVTLPEFRSFFPLFGDSKFGEPSFREQLVPKAELIRGAVRLGAAAPGL